MATGGKRSELGLRLRPGPGGDTGREGWACFRLFGLGSPVESVEGLLSEAGELSLSEGGGVDIKMFSIVSTAPALSNFLVSNMSSLLLFSSLLSPGPDSLPELEPAGEPGRPGLDLSGPDPSQPALIR